MNEDDTSEEQYLVEKLAGRLPRRLIDPTKGLVIHTPSEDRKTYTTQDNHRELNYQEWKQRKESKE